MAANIVQLHWKRGKMQGINDDRFIKLRSWNLLS